MSERYPLAKAWKIAQVCHEANATYCYVNGDETQSRWGMTPDWQKISALDGVLFHIDNPSAPPSASHENWLRVKLADGWKYGPVKNPETKEHPCCVPFEELPREQQLKDVLFKAIVEALR